MVSVLNSIDEVFSRVIDEISREVLQVDIHKLTDISSNLIKNIKAGRRNIIVHDGLNEIPASTMYWTLNMLYAETYPQLVNHIEYLYYIAPYVEDANVIVFIDDAKVLTRIDETCRLLGHDLTVISSSNIKIVKGTLYNLNFNSPFKNLLAKALTSILTITSRVSEFEKFKSRIERVKREIEDLQDVVHDMLNYYSENILRIVNVKPDLIITSPILKGHVEYISSNSKIPILILGKVRDLPVNSQIHIYKTSLEDREYGEVVKLSIVRGCRLYPIDLRTDPITAQIYGLILVETIRRLELIIS